MAKEPEYNKDAVDKEIKKDKRIKGKEAKAIHALLKGRTNEDHMDPMVRALVGPDTGKKLPSEKSHRRQHPAATLIKKALRQQDASEKKALRQQDASEKKTQPTSKNEGRSDGDIPETDDDFYDKLDRKEKKKKSKPVGSRTAQARHELPKYNRDRKVEEGTQKAGTIAPNREWGHLRPDGKKEFNKRDRKAGKELVKTLKQEPKDMDEALTAKATAKTWIKDFIHSKKKHFAGKSPEERKKMALGAYYAKQHAGVNESDDDQGDMFSSKPPEKPPTDPQTTTKEKKPHRSAADIAAAKEKAASKAAAKTPAPPKPEDPQIAVAKAERKKREVPVGSTEADKIIAQVRKDNDAERASNSEKKTASAGTAPKAPTAPTVRRKKDDANDYVGRIPASDAELAAANDAYDKRHPPKAVQEDAGMGAASFDTPEPQGGLEEGSPEAKIMSYLKNYIHTTIQKHLSGDTKAEEMVDEISTTGGVAGYLTPGAFAGTRGFSASQKKKKEVFGYRFSPQGKKLANVKGDKLGEAVELYSGNLVLIAEELERHQRTYDKPHQQIGLAISEVSKQLKKLAEAVHRQRRLKTENEVGGPKLWKRTFEHLVKLESCLMKMARDLREIRN